MTDKKKPLPDAKRHQLLSVIDRELSGAHYEETFQVLGKWYRLRTLDPSEEAWADSYVVGDNFYQMARNRRAPYVAAALVGIGEDEDAIIPIEQLFTPADDMPEVQRDLIDASDEFLRNWRRDEVLKWLVERSKHGPYVQLLYNRYLELDGKRGEAFDHLDPLSKGRQSGRSSDTSSPEKESSSQTPASNE